MEEVNISHKRIQALQNELAEARTSAGRPFDDINSLTRDAEKMTREIETLKRRFVTIVNASLCKFSSPCTGT
jgi:chromosome segregation ATPase